MSFGFSIGDIVLLSKLAYDLYSSVSDGRKAASGDLQELESVLFSLRCALDHLGDVSKDVLAKANQSDDGPDFTTKLDKMMTSCKATLQELDDVTKKYRELGIDSEPEATQPGKKKFTYEVAKKKVKVNWTKIRWDQEKRSLQSYREKLKSHTDAIQIIIISTLWSRIDTAEKASVSNHSKTQELLRDMRTNSETDMAMVELLQDIHAHLVQPQQHLARAKAGVGWSTPEGPMNPRKKSYSRRVELGINSSRPFAGSGSDMVMKESMPEFSTVGGPSLESFDNEVFAHRALPNRMPMVSFHLEDGSESMPYTVSKPEDMSMRPKSDLKGEVQLSTDIVKLNNKRREVAVKESNAYKERRGHQLKKQMMPEPTRPGPEVPSLTPGMKDRLLGLFRPLENNGMKQAIAASEIREKKVIWWMDDFSDFARDCEDYNIVVDLLVDLNEATNQTSSRMKRIFYTASDKAGFLGVLKNVQSKSRSIRMMKEIEEYIDTRKEWEEERR